jgi:hypothetical protein
MTFGEAIEALTVGHSITRNGMNITWFLAPVTYNDSLVLFEREAFEDGSSHDSPGSFDWGLIAATDWKIAV